MDNFLGGKFVHGVDCPKMPHIRDGYLHGEDDDSPYDVDGYLYCGRCHYFLSPNEITKESE